MAGTGSLSSDDLLNGRYATTRKLAQGGQGAVYEVMDTQNVGATYALKEMSITALEPDERADAIKDFHREAELLMELDHPNLVKVIERFSQHGKEYLVMEYIQGETLEEVIPEGENDSGVLPEAKVLALAEQLCDVLSYLHKQSPPIIYRDLKPANVMILAESGQIKLIDFGIVRLHKPGQRKDTKLLGTPGFAPPEQYGKGQTDARSDIFSLGVMLHVLLTGYDVSQNPWTYPPVRSLGAEVSEPLEEIITKATCLEPDKRFPNADAMTQALKQCKPKSSSRSLFEALTSRFAPPAALPKPAVTPPKRASISAPKSKPGKSPVPLMVRPFMLTLYAVHGETADEQLVIISQNSHSIRGRIETQDRWIHLGRETFDGEVETVRVEVNTKHVSLPRVRHPRPNFLEKAWRWAERFGASRRPWSETNSWWPSLRYGLPAVIGGGISQGLIWLTYLHADYLVPGSTKLSGAVDVIYGGGREQVPIQVEIEPNRVHRLLGWVSSAAAVGIELGLLGWIVLWWLVT